MKKLKMQEIKEYIAQVSDNSKIYIGCDSTAYKRSDGWYADFCSVVVIHKNGRNGCKIFGEVVTEKIFVTNKKKPNFRLMSEVYKVSELYLQLVEVAGDRPIEVHLDLNPDEKHASNDVVQQAIGYIKGTCNVVPLIKPSAFAASYAADRLMRVG